MSFLCDLRGKSIRCCSSEFEHEEREGPQRFDPSEPVFPLLSWCLVRVGCLPFCRDCAEFFCRQQILFSPQRFLGLDQILE